MKKLVPLLILIVFIPCTRLFGEIDTGFAGGERHRFYLIGGSGYATSYARGPLFEVGIEARLMGRIHARLLLDYYVGDNTRRNGETVKRMYGIGLYAVYKLPLTDTVDFRLKAGGHYTGVRSRMTLLGITLDTTRTDVGIGAGAGFSFQLSNRLYLYTEATVKHLMQDDPWTWLKGHIGLLYRLR